MKRNQILLPVLLPAALVLSVFYMVQQRMNTNTVYRDYLEAARSYQEKGVVTSALESYEAALAVHPTLEVSLAIGNLYLDTGSYRDAERWYENNLQTAYPEFAETYAFGIQTQLAQDNARKAFQIYDEYQKRGLRDDTVEQEIQSVWYRFDLVGDYENVAPFSNVAGLAAVQENQKWGYIDQTGKRIIANLYQTAGLFDELAPVVDEEGETYFIDQAGSKRLTASYFTENDPEFGQIRQFQTIQSGLVLAYNGTIWNYYDAKTNQKRFGGYEYATVISNGVGGVSHDGQHWALISSDGQELTDFIFDEVVLDEKGIPCRTDWVAVKQDGQYLLVDRATGNPLNETRYEQLAAFNGQEPAAARRNGRWIYINTDGDEMDLGDFEEVKSFSSGVAAAKQQGKWGYVDQQGNWIIEPQFEDAKPFTDQGVAFVKDSQDLWHLLSLFRMNHK